MRRKRQLLVDVISDMMQRHQEAILHVTEVYSEHLRAWHYRDQTRRYVKRLTEAVLDHLRTIEVEQRAALERELFDEGGG